MLHREPSLLLSDDPGVGPWEAQKGGDKYIIMADSCSCSAETNTTL